MTGKILDGRACAADYNTKIKQAIDERRARGAVIPTLAVILVGEDPASIIYVDHKKRACLEVGMQTQSFTFPNDCTQADIANCIEACNQDDNCHGILLQLPLPNHIDTPSLLEKINPQKDVDGFHPENAGRLAQGHPHFRPCTPYGIMMLLAHYHIPLAGKHAVIVGASNIVGRPMAFELLQAKATVTICHDATRNLEQHIRSADIIISAVGKPGLIQTEWLHQDMVAIDVGITRLADGGLAGDFVFETAVKVVEWITPVPGGVGPMTVAMLLKNTLDAAS